jgi:L-alanine-DL-glutamate epimerase-like enolase superfamily enzyme
MEGNELWRPPIFIRNKGASVAMKITKATVNITSPGRNFVTLKIETEEGIHGLGDGTLNGRELAVSSAAIRFKQKTSGNISIAGPIGGEGR